jgi:Co/Zn/Cd efflux system component
LEEIDEIHDFHIWALSPGKMAMSAHLRGDNKDTTLRKVNQILRNTYEIFHSTVQIEKKLENGDLACCDNDCNHKNHKH